MFNNEVILTIAQAILANTKVIQSLVDHLPAEVREKVASVVSPVAVVAPVIAKPVPVAVAPVATPVPVVAPAPVAAPAPVMPAPPVFVAPVAAPVATGAPFNDAKGLIDYVMSSYKALGAVKGAGIQGVLTGLGYQNINDVNPAHYGALFAGLEALKA